jgi:hypothetical protein
MKKSDADAPRILKVHFIAAPDWHDEGIQLARAVAEVDAGDLVDYAVAPVPGENGVRTGVYRFTAWVRTADVRVAATALARFLVDEVRAESGYIHDSQATHPDDNLWTLPACEPGATAAQRRM